MVGGDRARSTPLVAVFGPVRVGDTPLRNQETVLLATFVSSRGRSLSSTRLTQLCWPGAPLDRTDRLRTTLTRLRKHLPDGAIARDGIGYRLDLPVEAVDAWLFEHLVNDRDPRSTRVQQLAAALDLWRSDQAVFASVDNALIDETSSRLYELRTAAVIELATQAPLPADLLADLQTWFADEPARGDLAAALASTLQRLRRHADAVTVITRHRAALKERGMVATADIERVEHSVLTDGAAVTVADRTSLPRPATSFVGRERELEALARVLKESRHITLVGPGGVGKTRLVLQLAASFDGVPVAHVQMATVTGDPAVAVATELGFNVGAEAAADTLAVHLRDRESVLVLDTCEGDAPAIGALVEHLVGACPNLRVLCTSRRRLGNASETHVMVEPLNDDDAVALLTARMPRRLTGPTDIDRAELTDLVRRLDRLPLAVELAASQLGIRRVDDLVRDLTAPGPSDDRRTLASVLQRSVDLLRPATRDVVPALAVMDGQFDVDALAAVAGVDGADAARALADLADMSLVEVRTDGSVAVLDTVRAFAAAQANGRLSTLRDRHARHHSRCARRWSDEQFGAEEEASTRSVFAALDQLRAAFAWAMESDDLDLACDLTRSLHVFAVSHLVYDVVRWPEAVLDRFAARLPDDLLEEQAGLASTGAWFRSDADAASRLVDVAVAAATRSALPLSVHTANTRLALAHGTTLPPQQYIVDAIEAANRDPQPFWAVNIAVVMALGSASMGLADGTAHFAASATANAAHSPSPTMNAWAAYAAGIVAMADSPQQAAVNFDTAESLAASVGAAWVGRMASTLAATSLRRAGRNRDAAEAIVASLRSWTSTRFFPQVGYCMREAALQLAAAGDDDTAREALAAADSLRITLPSMAFDLAALDALRARLGVSGPHAPAPLERLVATTERIAVALDAGARPTDIADRRRRRRA